MRDAPTIHSDRLAGGRGGARPAPFARRMIGARALAAFAAIFGLYLQLAAAAACLAGSPFDAAAGLAASPICHTQTSQTDPADGDRGGDPGQPAHGACPFCSLHGHAGLAAAARPYRPVVPVASLAEPPARPARSAPPRPRLCSNAAPRGPPALG